MLARRRAAALGGEHGERRADAHTQLGCRDHVVDLTVNGETSRRSVRHDRDIEALIARYHRGMIAELGGVTLKAGENHIALRLAEPAARDMFRFASMRLIRR